MVIEQYIIGGLGTLIVGMCGAIWGKVNSLESKFDDFKDNCRDRHERVVTTDEWIREHEKLEVSIAEINRRLTGAGILTHTELDRR